MKVIITNPSEKIPFSGQDRTFLGEGLFETMRVYQDKISFAERHWQRMKTSADFLNIPFDLPLNQWILYVTQAAQLGAERNGGVKAILTSGPAPRGLLQNSTEPCLLFQPFSYLPMVSPLKLVEASWIRDCKNPIYQVKSINYLEGIMGAREALFKSADDVLFFNNHDRITETTVANVFIIEGQSLITPSISEGVLAGITRQRIIERAQALGVRCQESGVHHHRLMSADSMFVCNSLQGIRFVQSFNEQNFIESPLTLMLKSSLEDELLKESK